jgi:hypothetical protein
MENSGKTTMAAAMAGGYLLGRTKKAKLALGLVMLVAGRRLKLAPADLAMAGARQVAEAVDLGALREQVGEQLVGTIKTAASAAVDRQVASMVGSLRERSSALAGLADAAGAAGGGKQDTEDKEDEGREEPAADGDGEQGAENEEDQGRKKEPAASDKHSDEPSGHEEKDGHGQHSSGHHHHRRASRPSREEPKKAPAKRASSQQSSRSGR